jgi:hypothetical protein
MDPKRLWIYCPATNYIRPVQMIYLIALTYTFNYYRFVNDNIKGEIRKKTLLNKGTRCNNKLAPKFLYFFYNYTADNYSGNC